MLNINDFKHIMTYQGHFDPIFNNSDFELFEHIYRIKNSDNTTS